jgi:cytochrome c oxidase subunit 2
MEHFLGLPFAASSQAASYDHLQVMIHWLMFVLFIGWILFFGYVVIRFRKSRHPKAGYGGAKTKFVLWLAIVIAVIELVIDTGFSVPVWEERAAVPSEKDATVVRIVAEQFTWNVHYPGPDGIFGKTSMTLVAPDNPLGLDSQDPNGKDDITTINQLNIPVDKPVIIHLTSKDVIHSLNLVAMRVKQDAVPGLNIPVWFTPNVIGNYEIACAQLCGLGHYRMRGYLNVQSAADYQSWINEQEAGRTPVKKDSIAG